jgi:hypothetical protein
VSGYLLRERISRASPQELRRFGVRWVVADGTSPTIGKASSEVVVGGYHIRELATWDGRFARVERGEGEARVLRLDDEAVTIELTGTDRPALVALGTGYYPRWRARAGDRALPVYALPSAPGSELSVVAAWVPPGLTTFTPNGPLPSDWPRSWPWRSPSSGRCRGCAGAPCERWPAGTCGCARSGATAGPGPCGSRRRRSPCCSWSPPRSAAAGRPPR